MKKMNLEQMEHVNGGWRRYANAYCNAHAVASTAVGIGAFFGLGIIAPPLAAVMLATSVACLVVDATA